jgi:hypothetical protein
VRINSGEFCVSVGVVVVIFGRFVPAETGVVVRSGEFSLVTGDAECPGPGVEQPEAVPATGNNWELACGFSVLEMNFGCPEFFIRSSALPA